MKRRRTSARNAAFVVLPALAVAAAYVSWFGLPLRAAIATTHEQIRAIEARLPSAAELQQVRAKADTLRAELAAVIAARQPAPAAANGAVFAGNHERAQWRLLLSDALHRHDLTLVAEERVEVDLPPNVARGLAPAAAGRTHVSAWSLKVHGGYLDVLAALAALRTETLPFHLLELRMQRDDAGAVTWNLVVG